MLQNMCRCSGLEYGMISFEGPVELLFCSCFIVLCSCSSFAVDGL